MCGLGQHSVESCDARRGNPCIVLKAIPAGDWYCDKCIADGVKSNRQDDQGVLSCPTDGAATNRVPVDETGAIMSVPTATVNRGPRSWFGTVSDWEAPWRLWPTAWVHPPELIRGVDPVELAFHRWVSVDYDLEEDDAEFCREVKVSPEHFEWLIDRFEKRVQVRTLGSIRNLTCLTCSAD